MAQEINTNDEINIEATTTNKTSRRNFLRKWGLLSLAGVFGLSKMGNMPVVKAAVSDNATAKDISKDIIRCNTSDVFTSGDTAAKLADAVNGLNKSFSSALTDLKNTDVAKAVGANGSKFPTVITVLGTIKTYLSGAVSRNVQVGSSYTIPAGYQDGSSKITAVAKSGTNPTEITTNGTHSTGGYESVNVQVSTSPSYRMKTLFSQSGLYNQYGDISSKEAAAGSRGLVVISAYCNANGSNSINVYKNGSLIHSAGTGTIAQATHLVLNYSLNVESTDVIKVEMRHGIGAYNAILVY